MKKQFWMLTALVTMVMISCKEGPAIPDPSDNTFNLDSIPVVQDPDPTPDPAGVEIPAGAINVNEAVKIAKKLRPEEVTAEKYFIKGWVARYNDSEHAKDNFEENFAKYGNEYVYLSARQDGQGSKEFYAYRILGKFGAKLPDHETLVPGDFVVISCYMTNYNGIYESSGACFEYSSNNPHFNEVYPKFPGCPEPGEGEISVTEAEKIAIAEGRGNTTPDSYLIRGVVTSVSDTEVTSYGNLTFNISDGMSYATCYRLKAKNNEKFTSLTQLQVGDTILVNALIQNYNGTCEPTQGYVEESSNPNF